MFRMTIMFQAVERIMMFIDGETLPLRMSKADALDVLEQIEVELRGRMEALRAEIANERD